MASVINQLPQSTLSLVGNGIRATSTPGSTTTPSWGYVNGRGPIPDPSNSELQYTYSVDGNPNVRIINFNRNGVTGVKPPSTYDELDSRAPNNTQAGLAGSVVSQVYKSKSGRRYEDLGPSEGRY